MVVMSRGWERRTRQRQEVEAAILLAASGRFPRVTVANLDDATWVAGELAERAEARGVTLTVPVLPDGRARDIVVQRR